MTTVIVDYGSGNLHSAEKAVRRMSDPLGEGVRIVDDPEDVLRADRVILPGVGAFGDCAAGLRALDGMTEALHERVIIGGAPFLGICVGMQLMAEIGRERGVFEGLGWIPGVVERLEPNNPDLKIPHMGWNDLRLERRHPVLRNLVAGDFAYFVHSFCFVPTNQSHTLATVAYGQRFAAIVGRDNMIGSQFHPEKSQRVGLTLIDDFLRWRP